MKLGRVLPDRMWGSALRPPEAGATLRFAGVLMASRAKVAIVGGSISAHVRGRRRGEPPA
jgi:hypothetical protein